MKPRNKAEREVLGLCDRFPLPTKPQTQWAENRLFPKVAYNSGAHYWCSHCGAIAKVSDGFVCPKCGTRLKEIKTGRRSDHDLEYWGQVTTCKGWQVVRLFLCYKWMHKGEAPRYNHTEVGQRWMKDGRVIVRELPVGLSFNYYAEQPFLLYRELTFKREPRVRIGKVWMYPRKRITPEYARYGITGDFHGLAAMHVLKSIARYPHAETLWKAGQYELFDKFAGFNDWTDRDWWATIKICLRRGYHVKDVDLWMDYIRALRACGLDDRNPVLVCPDDLRAAHDRMIERKARKEARDAIRRLSKENTAYVGRVEKYLGLAFVDDSRGIAISVLPDVGEIKKEGDLLHHCMFKLGYYKKEKSLLMSARVNGVRTESIEYDLQNFRVLQCHGDHNQDSPYHKQILALINKHSKEIKKIATKTSIL